MVPVTLSTSTVLDTFMGQSINGCGCEFPIQRSHGLKPTVDSMVSLSFQHSEVNEMGTRTFWG